MNEDEIRKSEREACAKVATDAINYCRGNDIGSDLRSVRAFVADCILAGKVETEDES